MKQAHIFPGQGSQAVGMLSELATAHPIVVETFQQASDALNMNLWQLVQDGPKELLNQTTNTQPAMLAAGVAVWRVWNQQGGVTPTLLAGHSLGEYSALVAAEAIEFTDGVKLVAERGRLMQEAVPDGEGAMAAILGLDDDAVIELCRDGSTAGEIAEAVNFNSPGQVVIAGSSVGVEQAMGLAKERGAKRALPLPVSVPSHSSLMRGAAEKFAATLEEIEIAMPTIPVINNVDVSIESDPAAIRAALARQLYNPVRWVETIRKMQADGVESVVECGPGKVLAGLNRRIEKSMVALPLFDIASLEKAITANR
ncbi:MAG: ACP S-malonyltransferase [Thiotrichales bacterium]|jgi:[acyl-carrier-protein] S-malonyltransferase|nr:ACP S-malonyltransferase [Thiotrichales bacterium]MBT3612705.1 ACP S-malonyltransferase [Thiotrichales bacterium]MBT3752385.1 ACP S-malonyltransferase [Thiotrichales bacterium]MBT3837120.1 ACP S-malonyltransferase [Thiotrichales bacterium]MBT4152610.1 ACP S-malonyltransferase [Thiotrichales bacterium]